MGHFVNGRKFSREDINAAVELITNSFPEAFEFQKDVEMCIKLDQEAVNANYGVIYKALYDAGMTSNLIEANSLVFEIRRAARREVGLLD